MMEEQRLARIENKLDQLAEAVVSLARMEERMVTLFRRMDSYDAKQNDIEKKVDEIDMVVVKRGVVMGIIDRAFWLVGGVIAAVWARSFFS